MTDLNDIYPMSEDEAAKKYRNQGFYDAYEGRVRCASCDTLRAQLAAVTLERDGLREAMKVTDRRRFAVREVLSWVYGWVAEQRNAGRLDDPLMNLQTTVEKALEADALAALQSKEGE